jgi:predicted phage tail protein
MSTLRSKSFARIVDLISEGEIVGLVNGAKSIYLNGTPLENGDGSRNFSDVVYDTRPGTQSQTYISDAAAIESTLNVNTEVTAATAVVRTISNSDVNAARVILSVPALYRAKDDGSQVGTEVDIAIDVQASGGSYVTKVTDTIDGKATSKYQRAYKIALTGSAPWNIRVRRITADSTNLKLQNKTFWDTYTEIIEAKLRYPNSALITTKFDASAFQGIPTRGYDVKLLKVKVPTNYDPATRVYTGLWDGTFKTEWTDNPAWCFYDLVTNERYGLGAYIPAAQVDKWALYTISQYCDELVNDGFGGLEPRFTCNLYLQSRAEAFKVVQDLSSCFRSMVYWASGALTVAQDSPSDPVALFTQSNVIDGQFVYSGSSAKARHTVALVTWNDPADLYKQKVEYVEDADAIARFGVVPTEVVAVGCTSRGQAARVGRWLLFSERYEAETVTFQAGLEGAVARPGQVIKVADASRAGVRLGGRVRSATSTAVTLDAPVSLGASVWTIYAVLPNGTVGQSQVASAAGNTINLVTPLAAAPQSGAQWIMSTSTVEAQTFRVLTVVEQDNGQVEITALKHNPDKYDTVENGLVLQPRDLTALTPIPAAPVNLLASESLYLYQAEVRAKVSIGWENVNGASNYRVLWSKDGSNFIEALTNVSDFDILNITPGDFVIRVYSVGPTGKQSSTYAETTISAVGKTAPPATVTGLAAVVDPSIGITLTWDKVADLDLDGYEIKDGATVLAIAKTTSFKVGLLPTGTKTFAVRALDTSGNYSAAPASINVTIDPSATPTVTATQSGDFFTLTWTEAVGTLAVSEYIVRFGASFATGTNVANVKGTSLTIPVTWTGSRTFWVAAVNVAGITGSAGSAAINITLAGAPTVAAALAGENVVLSWNAVQGTLSTAEYEVRHGATYAGGISIGRIKGTSLQQKVSWTGSRTFWVAAIDVNGNTGSAGSATATISLPGAPTIASSFAGENVVLSWSDVSGTLPTDSYEVRYGASFAAGVSLGTIKGTSLQTRANWSGARTFWVAASDTNGNLGTAGSITATVVSPVAPTVASAFVGENVVLTWNAVQGTMPTDFYEVRYGASFAAGTSIGTIKGTTVSAKAQWSGGRTFWVAAVDINATTGAAGSVTATVAIPVAVTMSQEVIDNNVLLRWGDAQATLPVDYYELRRGSTWAGATVIGRVSARFSAIFESTAGTYTYRVRAYDVAGNEGAESTVAALVNQPPDYSLQFNQNSSFGGTRSNFVVNADSQLTPVSPTETWQTHFTSRSWATPQDQINAGFPIYAQPSQTSGSYEEVFDYGTTLAATRITATLTAVPVSGTVVTTPTLSVSNSSATGPWTDYAGVSSAFVSNFRWAKVRYDFSSVGGDDLLTVTGLNVRFDVKLVNDAGSIRTYPSQSATYSQTGTTITVTFTAHGRQVGERVDMDFTSGTATDGEYVITSVTSNTFTVTSATSTTTSGNVTLDSSGTPVRFNVTFVDVQSITVTPSGTSASIAVYNFVDVPNPTGFKILQFNTSGTRIAGTVGWNVKGV